MWYFINDSKKKGGALFDFETLAIEILAIQSGHQPDYY